jgi:hypothetical protein
VAAERLGELGGLPVSDAVGDLADGQRSRLEQLGGPLHADLGQVVAERGLADLGVRTLELAARRRDTPCDVVERRRMVEGRCVGTLFLRTTGRERITPRREAVV